MIEDEQKLIQEAKVGNAAAFGTLYDQYLPQIYRFIVLRVRSHEEAEDLTHEVFVNAWQNIPSYTERGFRLSSWLYQIARNRVIDHFRTKKSYVPLEDHIDDDIDEPQTVDDDIDALLALEKVQVALKQLGEEQQSVLIMRFVEDLPTRDVAEVLGKSEGAVRLIQHRALRELKKIIDTTTEA